MCVCIDACFPFDRLFLLLPPRFAFLLSSLSFFFPIFLPFVFWRLSLHYLWSERATHREKKRERESCVCALTPPSTLYNTQTPYCVSSSTKEKKERTPTNILAASIRLCYHSKIPTILVTIGSSAPDHIPSKGRLYFRSVHITLTRTTADNNTISCKQLLKQMSANLEIETSLSGDASAQSLEGHDTDFGHGMSAEPLSPPVTATNAGHLRQEMLVRWVSHRLGTRIDAVDQVLCGSHLRDLLVLLSSDTRPPSPPPLSPASPQQQLSQEKRPHLDSPHDHDTNNNNNNNSNAGSSNDGNQIDVAVDLLRSWLQLPDLEIPTDAITTDHDALLSFLSFIVTQYEAHIINVLQHETFAFISSHVSKTHTRFICPPHRYS